MIALIEAMRPKQWIKNFFVFAVALFAGRLFEGPVLVASLGAFAAFCAAGSATYLLNDLRDREQDRHHPVKRLRPLPSGRLSPAVAGISSAVLAIVALGIGLAIRPPLGIVIAVYLVMQVGYSMGLKHVVIVDVMLIATGFILRVIAGGAATAIPFSNWILINTFLLALFLGFGKRRQELVSLAEDAHHHRAALKDYGVGFLDQMIAVVASATAVVYMIYTASPEILARFGRGPLNMSLTIPFVLYGLFRYFYLVHQRQGGGNPTRELLTDGPLLINIVLYILTVLGLIYLNPAFHP